MTSTTGYLQYTSQGWYYPEHGSPEWRYQGDIVIDPVWLIPVGRQDSPQYGAVDRITIPVQPSQTPTPPGQPTPYVVPPAQAGTLAVIAIIVVVAAILVIGYG
jgi:hypothetical protein